MYTSEAYVNKTMQALPESLGKIRLPYSARERHVCKKINKIIWLIASGDMCFPFCVGKWSSAIWKITP